MANIDQVQLPDGSQYRIIDDTSGYATTTYVQDQIATINKNTIGLGNVDNTADINKPVSLLQQAALNEKVDDDIVAYVEGDTTATKRHEVGDQFILNGVLYTATAIIAVNDTIVIGTNCDSAESVATQITENANAIVSLRSDITSINQTGTTATQAISKGTYFYLNEVLVRAKTAIASGATFTLNTNYEVVTAGALNAIKTDLDTKADFIDANGIKTWSGGGTYDWCKVATLTVKRSYADYPILFEISRRGGYVTRAQIMFNSVSGTDPTLNYFYTDNSKSYYVKKLSTGVWGFYTQTPNAYADIAVHKVEGFGLNFVEVSLDMESTNQPSGLTQAHIYVPSDN